MHWFYFCTGITAFSCIKNLSASFIQHKQLLLPVQLRSWRGTPANPCNRSSPQYPMHPDHRALQQTVRRWLLNWEAQRRRI